MNLYRIKGYIYNHNKIENVSSIETQSVHEAKGWMSDFKECYDYIEIVDTENRIIESWSVDFLTDDIKKIKENR